MSTLKLIFIPLIAVFAVLTVVSCTGDAVQGTIPPDTVTGRLEIVYFQDKSISATKNGIPQARSEDFAPIIEALKSRGGELAIGLISDRSDVPLLRLTLSCPPPIPEDLSVKESNRFRVAEAHARYEEQLQRTNRIREEWNAETKERIEAFLPQLDSLLTLSARFPVTDISGAIRRAQVFLKEPGASEDRAPDRFAVFCTDGLHNRGDVVQPDFSPEVNILLIPGTSCGIFAQSPAQRFENPTAAFQHIVKSGLTARIDAPDPVRRKQK